MGFMELIMKIPKVQTGMFGDDPNDYMAKCGAKWLHKNGVNVLCMSPGKKNYSHVNFPLERIEMSIQWLKNNGNQKIGIMGMSTAGMDALVAASLFSDIRACEKISVNYIISRSSMIKYKS